MLDLKLSHLIRAGAIVHSVDGGVYRCTSKLASGGSINYRFADLQGKSIQGVPAGFHPISAGLARFAAWMRLVVAYNKDFDLYVKHYIQAAGLPIDPGMNWAKYFARLGTKLMSRDPEIQDEALHQIIVKSLVERNILSSFKDKIKEYNEDVQKMDLAQQVTAYLKYVFSRRISEANEYIKKHIFQEDSDSMWDSGDDDSEEVNLLETSDHGIGGGFENTEADIEIDRFRRGFTDYLHNKYREEVADQYLTLFDILYEEIKTGNDMPKRREVFELWSKETGVSGDTSKFKNMFTALPKLIHSYISTHLDANYEVHPFLEIMKLVGKDNKAREESAKAVAASFGGLKLAESFPINHEIDEPTPSSGSDGGGGGGGIPDLGGAAEGGGEAAEGLEAVAPLLLAASKEAAQWEVPKCKGCSKTQDVKDCPACKAKYCPDCILTHHANNPSHDRIASAKKADSNVIPFHPYQKPTAPPKQPIGDMKTLIRDVIYGGLYSTKGAEHFSQQGCDYCHSGADNVSDISGYRNLKDAQTKNPELEYDFKICSHCENKLSNWGD